MPVSEIKLTVDEKAEMVELFTGVVNAAVHNAIDKIQAHVSAEVFLLRESHVALARELKEHIAQAPRELEPPRIPERPKRNGKTC